MSFLNDRNMNSVGKVSHVTIKNAQDGSFHFEFYVESFDGEFLGVFDLDSDFVHESFPDHIFKDDEKTFYLLYEKTVEICRETQSISSFFHKASSENQIIH